MVDLHEIIENHYFREDLYEDILNRLTKQGIDLEKITRADLSGVDEFHVRGAAVSQELAGTIDLKGASVLDVGCGLGGPCRMLADEFDCKCTGIDLSAEYIGTATKLSKLVGLSDRTTFVQGNATDLPFEEKTFDVVWTQHVQMNIPDKDKFYFEIFRVLKPGGYLLYYDIFKNREGEIGYPMPWASNGGQSFLFKSEDMERILSDLGFSKVHFQDQTKAGVDFFEAFIAKLKKLGPPKIGLNVLMGETTKPKILNLLTHLKQGTLALQSGAYRKWI